MIKNRGFTLIELLVVIAIISMLAGQLLPALSTAREKGRQANCINNLHQFSLAIEMYYQDYDEYPPWLSVLYPTYLDTPKIFACLTDMNRGKTGHGNVSYPEANDIPPGQIPAQNPPPPPYSEPYGEGLTGFYQRNPEITANSYIYEFNPNKCQWFMDQKTPDEITQADKNGDGSVSWKEARLWESTYKGYRGHVPIVKCYWHNLNHGQKVLNLAYEDYNVFTSGPEWETSSY